MDRLRPKSPENAFMTLGFVERHGMTPEIAQVARATVIQNCLIVDMLFSKGFINQEDLQLSMRDDELLGQYAQMIEAQEKGIDDAFELLFNDVKDDTVEFCGWLLFQNEYLNAKHHLNFIPKSEGDFKYDDFINGVTSV
jgi:hypothetical protein